MTSILWRDENDFLAVTLFPDASAELLDKLSGARWRMGRVALQEDGPVDAGHVWLRTQRSICEQYPGRFHGEPLDSAPGSESGLEPNAVPSLRFTLFGHAGRVMGRFTCQVQLDGRAFVVRIAEIDAGLPSLVFPPPLVSTSLVLPMGVGRWVRQPLAERYAWVYPTHLNMRWFGGLAADNDAGWLAILDEGAANAGALATELAVAPLWLQSLGRWPQAPGEGRVARYMFTTGGYVGLAGAYREYAQRAGLHASLREKIAETPAVVALHGGRVLSFMQANTVRPERFEDRLQPIPADTPPAEGNPRVGVSHAQAGRILQEARASGMTRALVVLRGWIRGGYDEYHPDVWPPDPRVGSAEELRRVVAQGGAHTKSEAEGDALSVALHDNYQDIYAQSPSWPQGVNRTRAGEPMPGGLWSGGQAYILSARAGLAYARRNWEQIATLAPQAMFIDTTTAAQFYESHEPGAEQSRSQDQALKLELLRFYKARGLALGSEEGADFGVPVVDWFENRHRRVAGVSIPLWPLVFHDAVFNARYGPGPLAPEREGGVARRWLADMLWGYPLLWDVADARRWPAQRTDFVATLHVDAWNRRVGLERMRSHRYFSADGEVEETVFDPGVALLANFADEPRTVEGVTLPAGGYVIRD